MEKDTLGDVFATILDEADAASQRLLEEGLSQDPIASQRAESSRAVLSQVSATSTLLHNVVMCLHEPECFFWDKTWGKVPERVLKGEKARK